METVGDIVIVPLEFQNSADPEFASMPTEFVVLANVSLIDWLRQEGPSKVNLGSPRSFSLCS